MYLTYQEYTDMGGTLDATSYSNLEFEAEATINWYTFNRLKKDTVIPEEVKRLMFYLISLAVQKANLITESNQDKNGAAPATAIKSQSNDGVSVSYNVLSAKEVIDAVKNSEEEAVDRFLQGVRNEAGRQLLYRGLYPGE